MKQILQDLKTGKTEVADLPPPQVAVGKLLIRSHNSVVSPGTERMLIEFAKGNLFQKALQQPDKVRMAFDKIKTDGIVPTLTSIKTKLEQPLALGYSNAGEVLAVGAGVSGFKVGDRVVSNGKHAEIVSVSANLCARIPDRVDDESAAYTVVAAIALQGIRLAQPTLGESIVVLGLGIIGLLTVQLLKAQGCRVLATDFNMHRLELAKQFGAETVNLAQEEDIEKTADYFSHGQGVDAVIITASTKSSDPVSKAAHICRKRGRIILVGVTGLLFQHP